MKEKEISELYIRLAFQYESAIDMLLAKRSKRKRNSIIH